MVKVYVLDCISLNCMVISLQNSVSHSSFLATSIFDSKLFSLLLTTVSLHVLLDTVSKSLNMGLICFHYICEKHLL